MHEMALTEGIMQIIEDQAKVQKFSRVNVVRLEIGALSHVAPEALSFCFEAVSQGGIANGAVLEILRIPGQAWCMPCSKSVPIAERYDACPDCGGHQLQVTEGDQMRIKDLEVE